ncbi:hypothetical protein RUND412_008798 [Rhizina undulata]
MSTHVAPPTLTFPPQTFQKLAPHPFLLRHLSAKPSTRPSGRKPADFRQPSVHTSALSHAHGSAVIRCGDTAVVAAVRGEVLTLVGTGGSRIKVERRDAGDGGEGMMERVLVPNLELGTGCSRDYHPGPPTDFAQATTERLRQLLTETTKLVDVSSLRIYDRHYTPSPSEDENEDEVKAYWTLYIDIVCISLDGNVLDAAWAAMVAALKSTRLPGAYWDADVEQVLCSRDINLERSVGLRELAFVASFVVVKGEGEEVWVLSDPDEFEEGVAEEKVLVCVDGSGRCRRIEKGGGVSSVEVVGECVERAKERFAVWEALMR